MTLRIATILLLSLLALPAVAQPAQPAGPPASSDDELDRPLSRALAYERRDVVRELLERPGSLSAADSRVLAREIGIPLAHAESLVEAARANKLGNASLGELLEARAGNTGLTKTKLMSASEAELRAAGLSQAQARDFVRYRQSAKRVTLHFRELRAISEARIAGERFVSESAASAGKIASRVNRIATALGLKAEPVDSARARAEAANLRAEMVAVRTRTTDALAEFRRADGTVDWNRMGKSEVTRGAGGVLHFAFALFLKELAVVLKTGDPARLQEFVDGLLTTDFFVNYGLFATGARAADVAYGRYVRRLSRKSFVSGVIRSNLVLAAGLAVPQVARGKFELDTYLVDVAALGISATAVKGVAEGVKGVYRLVRGGSAGLRMSGPVGWVYTAGETAVVLLIGDYLAETFDEALTKHGLRNTIKEAEGELNAMLERIERGEDPTPAKLREALEKLQRAYDTLRELELKPLDVRMRDFRRKLDAEAGTLLETETSLEALRARLESTPALAENLRERFGSTDAYLERVRESRSRRTEAELSERAERFTEEFPAALERAYRGEPEGDAPAPDSRLDLYDQETTLLLRALDATKDPVARRHIALAIERVRLGRAMDVSVLTAGGTPPAETAETAPQPGIVDHLSGAGEGE